MPVLFSGGESNIKGSNQGEIVISRTRPCAGVAMSTRPLFAVGFKLLRRGAVLLAAMAWTISGQIKAPAGGAARQHFLEIDRKSTRLNSSHPSISYAVFCLKK